MALKKLIHRPQAVVEERAEGLAAAYPSLRRLPGHTVRVWADRPAAWSARSDATPPATVENPAIITGEFRSGLAQPWRVPVPQGVLTLLRQVEQVDGPGPAEGERLAIPRERQAADVAVGRHQHARR